MNEERLCFLFGREVLDDLDEFDLDSESDRIELVEEYAALPPDAEQRNLRMALRTVAVNQILADDPPETWAAAQRLRDQGFDSEQVFSQLTLVIGEHLKGSLSARTEFDREVFAKSLAGLPIPSGSEIVNRVLGIVRSQPGIIVDRLVESATASMGSGNEEVVERLVEEILDDLADGPLRYLPGDRLAFVPDLVAGATFSHRFNEDEAELGILAAGFDLGAFSRFEVIHLSDGTELEPFWVDEDHLAWRGPDQWLDRFNPGDLLAVTIADSSSDDPLGQAIEATLSIEVITDEPRMDDEIVTLVRAAYDDILDEAHLPIGGDELAWLLLFQHRSVFDTIQLPMSELCVAAGLEVRAGHTSDDESLWRNLLTVRRSRDVVSYISDPDWQRILIRAVRVLDNPDAAAEEVRSSLRACADPAALDVLVNVLFKHHLTPTDVHDNHGADSPARRRELVDRAIALAKHPGERATAHYLACVLHERSGSPDIAEEHLKSANRAQPHLGPVIERLGWYRFDRGDARGAMQWWRNLAEPPQAAQTIQPFLTPGAGAAKHKRNDPCWCGSGRKYKQCHQNELALPPLPDRVGWLCRKASLWIDHAAMDVRGTIVELAAARATGNPYSSLSNLGAIDDDSDMRNRLAAAFDDPILFDAALHEYNLFDVFLRERGQLLPEDEQLLAASWLTIDRSVHEVITVDPGVGLLLRDLGTGEEISVTEQTASNQIAVGERYCARIVPDGASHQIIGGLFPVRAGQETAVLDLCSAGDPLALCAWVGALHQPPKLVNSPGMINEMFDTDAIDTLVENLGEDADEDMVMRKIQAELVRQAQTRWLDESVPALAGLTPREAAADPTRREQLERLLDEFEEPRAGLAATPGDGFTPFTYDVPALRKELGLSR